MGLGARTQSTERRQRWTLSQPWWRPVAVASAATSLAASALYPQALPASSTVGSVAVDCLLLFGILVAGWGADTAAA